MKRLNGLPKVTTVISGETWIQTHGVRCNTPSKSLGDMDSVCDLLSLWFSTLAAHENPLESPETS